MVIPNNQYSQFKDYLTQIADQKISYCQIGNSLSVSDVAVYRFLSGFTKRPFKMLSNFISKYPDEFARWPEEGKKINRVIQISDIDYFLEPSKLDPPPKIPATLALKNRTNIVIGYRGHQTIKDGQGMLFDHRTFQNITGKKTAVSYDTDHYQQAKELFQQAIRQVPSKLPQDYPVRQHVSYAGGLLVITGRPRSLMNEQFREKHEWQIIRHALNRGQPILAICAGMWRVLEVMSTWVDDPDNLRKSASELSREHLEKDTIIDVKDHSFTGGMIRLDTTGSRTTHNIQVHDVMVVKGTYLDQITKVRTRRFPVNSVHWKAVNPEKLPQTVVISAYAVHNPQIKIFKKNSTFMEPQKYSVEAVESINNTFHGTQWHPEGYPYDGPHHRIINYMAKMGETYTAKRQMFKQLHQKVPFYR